MFRNVALLFSLLLSISVLSQNYPSANELTGLKVGDKVSYFSAIDQYGRVFDLKENLENGPIIIVFYRGQWCPVCNKHLSNLQDSISMFESRGAKLIAVSPEKPDRLLETRNKTKATFSLLFDKDYKIAKAFDVLFEPSWVQRGLYNIVLGADLENSHSDDSQRLPIPATFVVNKHGEVIWRHFHADYKKRSSAKEILEVLDY